MENKITTSRATESMKDNLAKEVSRQREAIRAIARTVEKEKITKVQICEIKKNWMNSNGTDLSGSEDSEGRIEIEPILLKASEACMMQPLDAAFTDSE